MSDIIYAGQNALATPTTLSQLVSGYFGSPWYKALNYIPADTTLAQDLADTDLVEMANLPEKRTGVSGTIHIRTRLGIRHGPTVKYYAGRPREDQLSFSVSIADPPRVVANSLPEHVMRERSPQVCDWVALNRDALLDFWNEGMSWLDDEVDAFKAALKPIDKR